MNLFVVKRTKKKSFKNDKYTYPNEFWTRAPDEFFKYDYRNGTFWSSKIDDCTIKHSYIVILIKWKLFRRFGIPYDAHDYAIIKETDALVEKVLDE